ncbi:MAG: dihydrolipoamide acetyltransferase family protein [Nitrospinales bacterium]
MSHEIKLPALGDGIDGGDVVNILVEPGNVVKKDAILLELETEKAVVEVPSPRAGRIGKIHVRNGDKIQVGQVMFSLEEEEVSDSGDEAKPPSVKPPEKKKATKSAGEGTPAVSESKTPEAVVRSAKDGLVSDLSRVPAGPAARGLARELGIDLTRVSGTARGGRITLDDVKAYARRRLTFPTQGPQAPELPDFSQWGKIERKPLSSLRAKIADRMGAAWNAVPLVAQFDEADITELEEVRKKNAEYVKNQGGRLTVTVFVIKAVAAALKAFPQFNASLDLARGEIVYKHYCNVGVAVDTPSGLIVPVIKDVDKKSFLKLAVELNDLAQRTRDRKVSLEELRGGNISVSNLGGIGGTGFGPLVIPPDVAVIGLSRSAIRPVWRDKRFEPRLVMPFCVSYDHRVIDGADGARFARFIAHELENCEELMLGG